MATPIPEDEDREARLHARVIAAKEAYNRAKAEVAGLEMLRADLGLANADGRQAALKAAQIEAHALRAYGEAVREFTMFVLSKAPHVPLRER